MRGETVYVGSTAVDNVLVHPGEFDDRNYAATDISKPIGTVADYTLYFPMSYTGNLNGAKITVRGYECEVLGHCDHERPKQVFGSWLGQWDMTVRVKKTLSAMAETIQVLKTVVTRDTLGDRIKRTFELYNGAGQARKESESEGDGKAGTVETETWYFVVPWNPEYSVAATQQLSVVYDGRTYDVVEVMDVDWKHDQASMKAVWHG